MNHRDKHQSNKHQTNTSNFVFPEYVTNFATYNEAARILKQKGILNEGIGGIVTQKSANPFVNWANFLKEEYPVASGVGKTYASQQENPVNAPKSMSEKDVKSVEKNVSKVEMFPDIQDAYVTTIFHKK
jgi:hypothetical protein